MVIGPCGGDMRQGPPHPAVILYDTPRSFGETVEISMLFPFLRMWRGTRICVDLVRVLHCDSVNKRQDHEDGSGSSRRCVAMIMPVNGAKTQSIGSCRSCSVQCLRSSYPVEFLNQARPMVTDGRPPGIG